MSPQSNYGLWQWALGLWAGLLTFMIGLNYHRINSVKDGIAKPCIQGENFDKRLQRIEQKVPAGDTVCATHEEVNLLFDKLDTSTTKINDLTQVVTEFITIVKERLPKR